MKKVIDDTSLKNKKRQVTCGIKHWGLSGY